MLYISFIPQQYTNLIVSAQTDNSFTNPGVVTIECWDSRVFTTILDALGSNKKVTFDSDINELTVDKLHITENEYFGSSYYISVLEKHVSELMRGIPMYTYFRYIYLNNIFASKGIFISQDNKEDKYIEIIDTGDEELIKYLEEYLQILDVLNRHERIYQTYLNALNKLQYETDEDVMKQIVQESFNFFTSENPQFLTLDNKGWFSTVDGGNRESTEPDENESTETQTEKDL